MTTTADPARVTVAVELGGDRFAGTFDRSLTLRELRHEEAER